MVRRGFKFYGGKTLHSTLMTAGNEVAMIFTSNFKIAGHLPQAVAISLGVPRGWTGRRYTRLAPNRRLVKIMDPTIFTRLYKAEVLDKLDPMKVIRDLGGDNFIMLLLGAPGRSSVIAGWWRPGCVSIPACSSRSLSPAISVMRSGFGGYRQAGTRGEGIIDQVVLVVRFHRPAP